MGDMNDRQLLEDYVSRNSQEAFAALVQRHINLVYSVGPEQLAALATVQSKSLAAERIQGKTLAQKH